ncbi:MAG TPA: hypothetical protein VMD92_19130 [Acidobacteriaceae bacterium]|nr:hypothetical protein [Acidobacteriaceae bacterium]
MKLRRPVSVSAVASLNVLSAQSPAAAPQRTQFRILVGHFLERFFAHELASGEGDSRTRLMQIACALGIPNLVVTLYLYTPYHTPHAVRPYWAQVSDHYFYVLYSFVATGLLTIFEWDLFFPDLLDLYVLSHLPVRNGRAFRARVTAIAVLVTVAVFAGNILAFLVLPAAVDPPHLLRFWAAHAIAVTCAGLTGATLFLGLEGVLLGILDDRIFRKLALGIQGLAVAALLGALFTFPAVSRFLPELTAAPAARWFPPFWFLGMDQRLLDGPAAPPQFHALAHMGYAATLLACALTAASYPLAWLRRTKGLVEGVARRSARNHILVPLHGFLHHTAARQPATRAIWHFITQNLVRVARYRMVLVMVGGAGAALVFASVARIGIASHRPYFAFSAGGLRGALPIVAFWTVSGLRSTFLAPADQRGRWIFRATAGKAALPHIAAARRWTMTCSLLLTAATVLWIAMAEPRSMLTPRFVAGQILVAIALSVLLTDGFFLNVRTIPFTGAKPNAAANFALLLIPYLGFFPLVVMFTVALEPRIEASWNRLLGVAAACLAAHLGLSHMHRSRIADHLNQIDVDEDEEEFPLRLGLRY